MSEISELPNSENVSDDISYLVLEMHGDIKKIEQHLHEINNSIESNAKDIQNHRQDIDGVQEEVDKLETKIKVAGGIAAFVGTVAGIGAAALPALV